MPGILPMKVIKVGTSSQSRIAQACDRCRSKKIRCDGIRPTCTQCSSVGFECRTSDRLSRRAFPRGYTESLEERVRHLELEVNELKDLLDSKDEKIDMLSRMHANQPRLSITSESPPADTVETGASHGRQDTFKVQATPLLLGVENSDSYFMGSSSGRAFIETLKRRLQETGKHCNDFNPEAFLHVQGCLPLSPDVGELQDRAPPRLFSDRCVNVYFQEWAPLFPILHKPTLLRIYEDFVVDPDKVKSNHSIAQLYLVFNLAGLSLESPDLAQLALCEKQWTRALDSVDMETTMNTLQCLLLALLYSAMRADYNKVQYYKALAVSVSHRLGLHQSQKRFAFGALTMETRKKVFWTLYTLDCFTAAIMGLPKLLKEEDVQAEYPCDVDDEYVSEKGFQPSLPGEHTRLSNSLALFRSSRLLATVLEKIYPATATHELSLQQMDALASELDAWYQGLPPHLRLTFSKDKPSTDVTGSRSPLLALAFNYTRLLIYRPAIGSCLGAKSAHALMVAGDSCKHIVQIIELLQERHMAFSFCMNQSDLLMLCAMTLLYQVIGLNKESNLMRDNERLVNTVIKMVFQAQAPGSVSLRRIAGMLVSVEGTPEGPISTKKSRERSAPAPSTSQSTASQTACSSQSNGRRPSHSGGRAFGSISEDDLLRQQEKIYASTRPNMASQRPQPHRSRSRQSFENQRHEPLAARDHRLSMSQTQNSGQRQINIYGAGLNLDYLSLNNTASASHPTSPGQGRMQPPPTTSQQSQHAPSSNGPVPGKTAGVSNTEWESLLGSMDGGLVNVYDAIYGGSSLVNEASMNAHSTSSEWSPDSWDLTNFSIGDFGVMEDDQKAARSVQSISDESLSSGEEVAPSDLGLSVSSSEYQAQLMHGYPI